MKKFRDFESAREFSRKLGLKGVKEWTDYCKSGNKPDDMPVAPSSTYKNDFKGMGDFLGTGTVAPKDKVYRTFTEAREFVQKLGLKGQKEWHAYCKSGNKPDDIPQKVERTYKNDFKGFGDWLGTGRIANFNKQFRPFKEAREFVRSLNLKGHKEWQEYCKSGNKPDDIPYKPERTYKNDFKGFGDWLGTGRIANQDRIHRPFKEAREFSRSLGLKNTKDWFEYCKSGNKPDDISVSPSRTYKNDFKGIGDWLGTGTVASQNKQFCSFKEARDFVRSLGLKNDGEWRKYCKSGNKPDNIPSAPWNVYKEWKKK